MFFSLHLLFKLLNPRRLILVFLFELSDEIIVAVYLHLLVFILLKLNGELVL